MQCFPNNFFQFVWRNHLWLINQCIAFPCRPLGFHIRKWINNSCLHCVRGVWIGLSHRIVKLEVSYQGRCAWKGISPCLKVKDAKHDRLYAFTVTNSFLGRWNIFYMVLVNILLTFQDNITKSIFISLKYLSSTYYSFKSCKCLSHSTLHRFFLVIHSKIISKPRLFP